MRAFSILATLGLVAGLAVGGGLAHGDADPPSDVLYLQDAYYPYHPKVSTAQQNRLDDLLKRTRRAGLPMKVAIIATATDLGAIPQLFGKPQQYAHFLEQELSVHRNLPLLTVMPAGYGTAALGPRAAAITGVLPHSAHPRRDGLRRRDGRAAPRGRERSPGERREPWSRRSQAPALELTDAALSPHPRPGGDRPRGRGDGPHKAPGARRRALSHWATKLLVAQ